ncbi:MAG: hypothetical protein EA423_02780 [Phycisphaerales bacterium]|nr:MAG: hypothetical protein EA423_02780 [Phycisphaerales bacterium]
MGVISMAVYRPRPGREEELRALIRERPPIMRRLGYLTEREHLVLKAADGTLFELSEWVSREAIDRAHGDPEVLAMWAKFDEVCEYLAPAAVEGMDAPFPTFEPQDDL